MHKQEASLLFSILGNEDCVKMAKMLYNKGEMNLEDLKKAVGTTDEKFDNALNMMLDVELVFKDKVYKINEALLKELLAFIVTPCSCVRK